jgi:hypothetical protein
VRQWRKRLEIPNSDALALDFYDRKRLESWLRDHSGTVLWVRETIGKPIPGWSAYGAWSNDPEGAKNEYLLDGELRIRAQTKDKKPDLSAIEGIGGIRDILRNSQGIARLVGLSGVGKTRLVQALFDSRVGKNSLDPELAIYTNISDDPNPTPIALATELMKTRKRAIFIVDNCPPDMHGRLSEVCRSNGSMLSLVTIEYDIQDDQGEGTDVFVLEVASINLTKNLIRRRFPQLSPVDAKRVADFSGGNARIAIAIAERIEKDDSIATLSDSELFRRLFQQRHEHDEVLFIAAQALSLVYSFQGENVSEDDEAELSLLGTVIGKTSQEMFKHCAELERRGLMQRRGAWRAVLPHAIANRLAALALQNIPPSGTDECFVLSGRERLLRSFSRRLGYLSASMQARSIVSGWLGPEGMLKNPMELSDLGYAIFNNIAPVVPEATLAALERVLLEIGGDQEVSNSRRNLRLIRSLAYDASLFERCIALMVKIIESENLDNDQDESRRIFPSLFTIYYSGTHATVEQRLTVIKSLIFSEDPKKRSLGLAALTAALKTSHFGGWDFEFGAVSRDFGWWPRTVADIRNWFTKILSLVEDIACSQQPIAHEVRDITTNNFRSLWSTAGMYDELERIFHNISGKGFWPEGWIAIRQTIHYDSSGFSPEVSARLASLEVDLRPKDLLQKVRSIVLSENVLYAGTDSTVDSATGAQKTWDQVENMAQDLGRSVASDQQVLAALLPELLTSKAVQLWNFGRGLAEGAEEPRALWNRLVEQLAATSKEVQNVRMLCGFLHALNVNNLELVSSLLDGAVKHEVLGPWFPLLQTTVPIDDKGVERLIRSLDASKAGVHMYKALMGGGVSHGIPGSDFNSLLKRIAVKPAGLEIALEILHMRVVFAPHRSTSSELIDIGCELMGKLTFSRNRRNRTLDEYSVGIIAKKCLVAQAGAAAVRKICRNLKQAVSNSETYPFYHADLLGVLLEVQPLAVLESLCAGDETELRLGLSILEQNSLLRHNSLDMVPEHDLFSWCDQMPEVRYPAVASAVTAFRPSNETGKLQLTSVGRKLLGNAPDRVGVLKSFMRQLAPAELLTVLDEMVGHGDPAVLTFVANEKIRLTQVVQAQRQMETWMAKQSKLDVDERFE